MKKLSIIAASLLASTLYTGQALGALAVTWNFTSGGNVVFQDDPGSVDTATRTTATVTDMNSNGLSINASALLLSLDTSPAILNGAIVYDSAQNNPPNNTGVANSAFGMGVYHSNTLSTPETSSSAAAAQMNNDGGTFNGIITPVIEVLKLDLTGLGIDFADYINPKWVFTFASETAASSTGTLFVSNNDLSNDGDYLFGSNSSGVTGANLNVTNFQSLSLAQNADYFYLNVDGFSLYSIELQYDLIRPDRQSPIINSEPREGCDPNDSDGCGGNIDTPEPGIVALLGLSLAGLAILRRKQ